VKKRDLVNKKEAAEMLGGVSLSFVNSLLSRRKLPRVRLSYKVTKIPRDAVEKFIASRTEVSR
jgi:excisionase family DNA binding protein